MNIRTATPSDAEQILRIYAPYIEQTAITFEYDVPTIEEFRERIAGTLKAFPYLVAEEAGRILGYTYAGKFQTRRAYDRCAETSIYVDMEARGKGIGGALYTELEACLKAKGILNVNACITWVDEPCEYVTHQSPEFHEHLGYKKCAHFHQCGYKFGRWFDMIWMEKMIGAHSHVEL